MKRMEKVLSMATRRRAAPLLVSLALVFLSVGNIGAAVFYVDVNSAAPAPPYTTWATAATSIQDAIDAANEGDEVVVTNGVYQTGGRAVDGSMMNRVVVTRPVTVRSVNGPEVTVIAGFHVPCTTNCDSAVRCVYLTNGATLMGFTLTNGGTRASGDLLREQSGGGIWCESASILVSNCVFSGNSAIFEGGGAYGGTLNNCTLTGNSATEGGGSSAGTLNNCNLTGNSATEGGGASGGTLNNCTLTGNSAQFGGGSAGGTLDNCSLTSNSAYGAGGGAFGGTLNMCTLRVNSAQTGGGVYMATMNNCNVSSNSAALYGGGAFKSTLIGCMLTGNGANQSGGGAYGSTLSNCVLTGNEGGDGGGAFAGSLDRCVLTRNSGNHGGGAAGDAEHGVICALTNCTLTGNSAHFGGAAAFGTLIHCTVTGNSANYQAGGAFESILSNCIVYFNTSNNYSGGTMSYCCTTPQPTNGTGNLAADPQLADASHVSPSSPCLRAGGAGSATGTDIDGEPWANPPSIGCDEYRPGAVTGSLVVAFRADYTNVSTGFPVTFTADIAGHAAANRWTFGDGTVVSNRPYASHDWAATGEFSVVLTVFNETYPNGVSATLLIRVGPLVHYVAADSANPDAPYTSWATAARTIQQAVDAAAPGAGILVSNGVYETGGRFVDTSNRVAVTKPLRVESVNGPAVTVIRGYQVPLTTNGDGAVRCVYLTNGAVLAGFTLRDGAARAGYAGGGVAGLANAVVTNCVVIGNVADDGGGAAGGTLNNCVISDNSAIGSYAYGGGVVGSVLNHCVLTGNSARYGGGGQGATMNNCKVSSNSVSFYGGGASGGALSHCALSGNSAQYGGGVSSATLNDCTLSANSASYQGGGAYYSTLNNCTVSGNSTSGYGGGIAGGVFAGGGTINSVVNNCIVHYNRADWGGANYFTSTLNYCSTSPQPIGGTNNITLGPLFVDVGAGNLRLQSNSPCIDAGNNGYVTNITDLDGRPRIVGARVDMGAYEYQPNASGLFIGWLLQYDLPTDGSADTADPDGDRLNNRQEWVAGTNPTNAQSVLRLLTPTPVGHDLMVSWESVPGRSYFLDWSTSLGAQPGFKRLATHLPAAASTTIFTHTNAAGVGPLFYRVGVE